MFQELMPIVIKNDPAPIYNFKLNNWLITPKFCDLNNDVYIWNKTYLRMLPNTDNPTIYYDAYLVRVKNDNTESLVRFLKNIPIEVNNTFKIERIIPIPDYGNNTFFSIFFSYTKADGYRSSVQTCTFTIIKDGSLVIDSTTLGSIVSPETANYNYEYWIGKNMSSDPILITKYVYKPNNTVQEYTYAKYFQPTTGRLTGQDTGNYYIINLNSYGAHITPDFNKCPLIGGCTYKWENNNNWYLGYHIKNYYTSPSNMLVTNGGDIKDVVDTDQFFLGFTNEGFFVSIDFKNAYIYIWHFRNSGSATTKDIFTLLETIDISEFTDLLSDNIMTFMNDTILTNTGHRYHLTYTSNGHIIDELSPYELDNSNPWEANKIIYGPETDLLLGALVINTE